MTMVTCEQAMPWRKQLSLKEHFSNNLKG